MKKVSPTVPLKLYYASPVAAAVLCGAVSAMAEIGVAGLFFADAVRVVFSIVVMLGIAHVVNVELEKWRDLSADEGAGKRYSRMRGALAVSLVAVGITFSWAAEDVLRRGGPSLGTCFEWLIPLVICLALSYFLLALAARGSD